VAARKVHQIDATGAGDAFAAGVVHALLGHQRIEQAMELGAELGAAAVERLQSVPPEWFEASGAT
jgi:sugar/nucleoside kinase (ribokinase family)